MSDQRHGDHSHHHGSHDHDHEAPGEVDVVLDASVPDSELSPAQLGRRGFLRSAGILGVGGGVGSVLPAAAAAPARPVTPPGGQLQWLVGDHHIHTQYSSDAQYRVVDQVQHAEAYGLDWIVITDHGGATHATWGGFDWITSTVGGLWDSLLAEGKARWISANSDADRVYLDDSVRGPGSDFDANGRYDDPGARGRRTGHDLRGLLAWLLQPHPRRRGRPVLRGGDGGLRAGRVWVDHGGLLAGLDVSVRTRGSRLPGTPLGSVRTAARGERLELAITVDTATLPNWAQFVPRLARVDVIRDAVTGVAADRDTFSAPQTRVAQSFDVAGRQGRIELRYDLGSATEPFYVRMRGTDGRRSQVGPGGTGVAPTAGGARSGPGGPASTLSAPRSTSWATPTPGTTCGSTSTRSGRPARVSTVVVLPARGRGRRRPRRRPSCLRAPRPAPTSSTARWW